MFINLTTVYRLIIITLLFFINGKYKLNLFCYGHKKNSRYPKDA